MEQVMLDNINRNMNTLTVEEPPVVLTETPLSNIEIHRAELEEVCRCGCVPKDMMSMFQMAELRAKHR
jgi:hypothetical protein